MTDQNPPAPYPPVVTPPAKTAPGGQVLAIVRLAVAYAIGFVVALLAKQGIHVPDALEQLITGAITAAAGTAVTYLLNWLSKRFPWLGHVAVSKPVKP